MQRTEGSVALNVVLLLEPRDCLPEELLLLGDGPARRELLEVVNQDMATFSARTAHLGDPDG